MFAVIQSANYKFIAHTYDFSVFYYFILRNTALVTLTGLVVYLLKIPLFDFPDEKPVRQWLKLIVIRSLAGHIGFFAFNLGV